MRTIAVDKGERLPLCSACRDPRSLWFLVARSRRLDSFTPPASATREASAEQRRGAAA